MRNFSQTPSCQAHVIQNVNAGIRAFFVSGEKARFDGVHPVTGEKRFKAVMPTEDKVLRTFDTLKTTVVKGTSLEFRLSPTITALLPSIPGSESPQQNLGTEGLLCALSTDFAHALKTLSLTLADLKRLSALGSLPISLTPTPKGPILSVRFPGCDAATVSLLSEELGVFNGVVREDAAWTESHEVEMALLFPFAPTGPEDADSEAVADDCFFSEQKPAKLDWQGMMTPSSALPTPFSSTGSYASGGGYERVEQPAVESPEGYGSMRESEYTDEDAYFGRQASRTGTGGAGDLEGISRFLSECEGARRR